jgi:UDP-N-acetylglucosamine 2-epimerase (non-hydrolysing)
VKIINVVGARPNFMKIAPIMEAYKAYSDITPLLVHTGQHYDQKMSDLFFRQLEIPEPDLNLEVGSASRISQTAQIMQRFEPVVAQEKPDAVLVVGDVNSTVACGLVAVDAGVKLIHVEAGLRSFDRNMPEETNRILTDSISDLLFCTEQSGVDNLLREGISRQKIHLVGNVMVDTLLKNRARAEQTTILEEVGVEAGGYAVLTLHRPSNVDDTTVFGRLLDALELIQMELPIIFPVHPRTRQRLLEGVLGERVSGMSQLWQIDPLGYLEFLKLLSHAKVVLTDSGGIQEETTLLGVPCLTLRENTERPVTCELGTNRLVGTNPKVIHEAFQQIRSSSTKRVRLPDLWDGRASERLLKVLDQYMRQ